ncbi:MULTISPECIES: site-specific integrase [unclassified Sphingomonas]|nr:MULTISPECIES: site-specific integrase [unclassified Sphingomonas]
MPHPARVLARSDLQLILRKVATHRHPDRDRVIVLLSFKAGLRACEIAGLQWSMVLRPNGTVSDQVFIASTIAKYGRARRIPLHSELAAALDTLRLATGRPRDGPIVRSERGCHMNPHSVVNWFARLYATLHLDGCSSHSGRRTFITSSARVLAKTGGSLRDIQELAGHRQLVTTERYIEGSREAQRRLIRLL